MQDAAALVDLPRHGSILPLMSTSLLSMKVRTTLPRFHVRRMHWMPDVFIEAAEMLCARLETAGVGS